VVNGDAGTEQTGIETRGFDFVAENQVFEVIISGSHAELEALSRLVATAGPDQHNGSVSAPGEAQVELRLGECSNCLLQMVQGSSYRSFWHRFASTRIWNASA
jgi:hypothetical protein